jgi:hypothetical protein
MNETNAEKLARSLASESPMPPALPPVNPSVNPLPPAPGTVPAADANGFWKDAGRLDPSLSFQAVMEALLKRPARVVREIIEGSAGRMACRLLGIAGGCLLIYGFIMGTFSGGQQLWVVPIKIAAGGLLSALICLPSLYIFSCVAGGQVTLKVATGLLAAMLALTGLLLVGLAPIAWLFSQATKTTIFMGWLHLLFWLVTLRFGLRLLMKTADAVGLVSKWVLAFWGLIFVLVSLQIATNLRPIIGPFSGFAYPDKMFFVEHWWQSMKAGK